MRFAPVLLLLLTSLGACGDDSATLVVELRTDFEPGYEFTRVRTEVGSGLGSVSGADLRVAELDVGADVDFIVGSRIAEFAGLPSGGQTVRAQLLGADGSVIAERRIRVDLEGSIAVVVLITRDCVAVTCPMDDPAATECLSGRCIVPGCVDGTEPACGVPACTMSSECAPMAACAEARCDTGACVYARNDDLCSAGERCSVERGCEDVAPPTDAGTDARADTAAPADTSLPDTSVPDTSVPDTTPACPTVTSCVGAACTCPPGCACTGWTCPTGASCTVRCETGATCVLDASAGATVDMTCDPGSDCTLSGNGAALFDFDCSGGADCDVDCTDVSRCRGVCDDATCSLDCTRAAICLFTTCNGETGSGVCPGDLRTCNVPCP